MELYDRLDFHFETVVQPVLDTVVNQLNENKKEYMAGIMKMKAGDALYPDANFTLRVAYGKVEGYEPRDGVIYKHYTTLEGVIEKKNPEVYEFDVPECLEQLYESKNYGRFASGQSLPLLPRVSHVSD